MKVFKRRVISAAVSSIFVAGGAAYLPAYAQEAASGGTSASLDLNQVVVTGSAQAKSKMRSSLSVTDVDQEQIKDYGAHSEAEVLLLIPGIRTDPAAGPGGNANITVRGLPISSGGSKYVQMQEDGLPTVQFGDMNFSNNDYWIRFDNNVDNIQTLRGGSSSVFASQAPGAVINYISKTGKEEGGSIGLTNGLNYRETRADGDVGGKIGTDMYYHIGGYYRQGEGARNTTKDSLLGYQLKGNLTKVFNGGNGYFRVNFKALDEHAPTTPQTFITATRSGNTIGNFGLVNGYDGSRDSQYSIYNSTLPGIDPLTRQLTNTSLTNGITAKTKSVGFEFHNLLDNGVSVDNKFRISQNSGGFNAQFWDVQTLANMLSGFGAGATAKYYNGPLAGQVVSAANLKTGLVSKGAAIDVTTPDMGNMVNDLSVNKQFKLDNNSTVDVRAGLFTSRQNVVQRWSISERVVEAGNNGAILDVFSSAGAALTTAGLTGYNNQWGGCCARDIDASFTTTAPYLGVNFQAGQLDIDAGVRRESFQSNATYIAGSAQKFDVNGDGKITGAENNVYLIDPNARRGLSNYKVEYTNYSLGANYRLSNDLSAFVRYSEGNRAIADRLLFSANIDANTGNLTAGGADAAVAPVKQSELGVKYRGRADWGTYAVAATYFHSTTNEFDYDQTRQDDPTKPNYQGPKLNVLGYKSDGVELEGASAFGNFALNASLVYSKEEMTANAGDPSQIGKTSGGVPKVRYMISPRYQMGQAVLGATIRGQSEVFADGNNVLTIDGYYMINAFVKYDFGRGIVGSLNVNNLTNKIYPTGGGGFVGGSSTVFGAGVENGRTISASVRYNF